MSTTILLFVLVGIFSVLITAAVIFIRHHRYRRKQLHDEHMYDIYMIAVHALTKMSRDYDIPYDQIVDAINAARETYNESLLLDETPRLSMLAPLEDEKNE